jgi:hypothetical protein
MAPLHAVTVTCTSGPESSSGLGSSTAVQGDALIAGTPSLHDLIRAHQETGRPRFAPTRAEYERHHGMILEEHFAPTGAVAAVLIRQPRRFGRGRYRIRVAADRPFADPGVGEILRRICLEEGQSAVQLGGRAHQLLVQALFSLIVCLFTTLHPSDASGFSDPARRQHVRDAVKTAGRELATLSTFVQKSARRTALGLYLSGLPLGAVIGYLLVRLTAHSLTVDRLIPNDELAICLASGAIGAVISVMARITRGERVCVDSDKGKAVTVLAGSFRPVIGAVFGGVLYVLICGGILPLSVPGPDKSLLFFAGVAFLAGFTERWAQDAIVSSAPKISGSRQCT